MRPNRTRSLIILFMTGMGLAGEFEVRAKDGDAADTSWKAKAISPVTNPLFFEDPRIQSEVRPIFLYHQIDESFITGGGNAQVYAAQLRWAVTDRLAIIATKDGFIEFNPKRALKRADGWADIAAGLKYAVIDNEAAQFILTPCLKLELPSGNRRVFQGNGRRMGSVRVRRQGLG